MPSQAKNAIYTGDFPLLGDTMDRNTDVQRAMHKGLVCAKFEEIIDVAKDFDVLGCKVNGAGGDGGSLTILTNGDAPTKRKLLQELTHRGYDLLHIYLSRYGLRVW